MSLFNPESFRVMSGERRRRRIAQSLCTIGRNAESTRFRDPKIVKIGKSASVELSRSQDYHFLIKLRSFPKLISSRSTPSRSPLGVSMYIGVLEK